MTRIDKIIEWAQTEEDPEASLQGRLDSVSPIMDDEIREQVHSELAPCTAKDFLVRYDELHTEKYGEDFDF